MIEYVYIILLSISDRFRGYPGILPKQVKRLIESYLVAASLGYWNNVYITIAQFIAICIGSYGNVVGPAVSKQPMAITETETNSGPEWWQKGILVKNKILSQITLGLLWGILPALVGYYMGETKALILIIAWPIAYLVGCKQNSWANQQWITGFTLAAELLLIKIMGY